MRQKVLLHSLYNGESPPLKHIQKFSLNQSEFATALKDLGGGGGKHERGLSKAQSLWGIYFVTKLILHSLIFGNIITKQAIYTHRIHRTT